jgi:hypothetical protein
VDLHWERAEEVAQFGRGIPEFVSVPGTMKSVTSETL